MAVFAAPRRPSAVYLPVPDREDHDVHNPDEGCVTQEGRCGLHAPKRRKDQEYGATGHGDRHYCDQYEREAAGTREGLAVRVERLFDAIKDPKTGQTYTPSKIARMSLGDLTEADVVALRNGSIVDPPLSQVIALARAFGVEPSYLVDGTGEAILDAEMVEALRDDTTRAIARESARLRDRERNLALGIVRQFEGVGSREEGERGAPSRGR